MQFLCIHNSDHPSQAIRAQKCDGFFCRLRGLMFQRALAPGEGLLMIHPTTSRSDASIHMMFMNFDLAVVWLDDTRRVVDVKYCKRWRPAYVPAAPARYVLELHASRLKDFAPGDQLEMEPC